MLDARFSHLYFCQSLPTLQRDLSAIADLLVYHVVDCQCFSFYTITLHYKTQQWIFNNCMSTYMCVIVKATGITTSTYPVPHPHNYHETTLVS